MENKYSRINIVFKPPQKVIRRAITLSKEISKKSNYFFVLDGIKFHPHITIYSPEFPEYNLNKIIKTVKSLTNNFSKVDFKFKKISAYKGFISIHFNCSIIIKRIHKEIVEKLNPLREDYKRKKYDNCLDYHMHFNSEQKKNIKKYGYPDSMNLYSPHLTIIRLKDELYSENLVKNINWDIPKFTVDKIAIYNMGDHGTCKELIREFKI